MPRENKNGGFPLWRMKEPCDDCPFSASEAGVHLRKLLRRWPSITAGLRKGQHFLCHKTTQEEGWTEEDKKYEIVGSELICAGSIDWQAKRGLKADLVQVMERMELARLPRHLRGSRRV